MLGKACAFVGGNDRKARARFERSFDEIVAVAVVTLDGEERFAGRAGAAFDEALTEVERKGR